MAVLKRLASGGEVAASFWSPAPGTGTRRSATVGRSGMNGIPLCSSWKRGSIQPRVPFSGAAGSLRGCAGGRQVGVARRNSGVPRKVKGFVKTAVITAAAFGIPMGIIAGIVVGRRIRARRGASSYQARSISGFGREIIESYMRSSRSEW